MLKATIHLASGGTVETLIEGEDDETALADVEEELTGDAKPGWRQLGNVVFFSQAISAVQVEDF